MKKSSFSMRSIARSAAAVILCSLVFVSCKKNNNDNPDVPVAGLMVFNLAPDKAAVGFALSGNYLTNVPLGYASYTGNYLNIYPGQRILDVYDAGNSSSPFTSITGNFEVNKYYSLFLVGADSSYKNIIVNDDVDSTIVSSGKSYIRYVNAIPDSVNVPTVTVSTGGNAFINSPAPFATVSAFVAVNAGDIKIAVKNTAAIDASRTITVEQNKVYTILLSGIPGSGATPVEIKYILNGSLADSANKSSFSATND